MQYELTTSKSSSAIARPNNSTTHLIDCFRRFAGKSKSKKKLFNFGFNNNNKQHSLVDSPLNIDQKQKYKRFGSTPSVHVCRTEFLHFSPCPEEHPGPSLDTSRINQSCYGALPTQAIRPRKLPINDDYDNMNGVVNSSSEDKTKQSLANRRSRKALSEVGCPVMVVEVGNSRRLQSQTARNNSVWRTSSRNSFLDSSYPCVDQQRSQFLEKLPSSGPRPAVPDKRHRLSNFYAGTTGANQSALQSPLPAANVRPAVDFGAFAQADSSALTESNETGDEKRKQPNSAKSSAPFANERFEISNGVSRSSSLAGQIHCDASSSGPDFEPFADRHVSRENDMFRGYNLQHHYGMESRLMDLQKSHDELFKQNVTMSQQLRDHQQLVATLKEQLNCERKRFADEKRTLLREHQEELKQKDDELVRKELSVMQRLSLNTPLTENKFDFGTSDSESNNKMPLSENTNINSPLNRPNGALRPQSLYISSTPSGRPLSAHDLVGKDRHRNMFMCSNNQLHLSRSPSTTPDSGAVLPLSSSPNLIPLFRELVTCVFHLHNSSDHASMFTNSWLKNVRPQICSPHLRIRFAGLLEQMQNEDIEVILEQTIKLLHDCIDTLFGLKRDLIELHKREMYKVEAQKQIEKELPGE